MVFPIKKRDPVREKTRKATAWQKPSLRPPKISTTRMVPCTRDISQMLWWLAWARHLLIRVLLVLGRDLSYHIIPEFRHRPDK